MQHGGKRKREASAEPAAPRHQGRQALAAAQVTEPTRQQPAAVPTGRKHAKAGRGIQPNPPAPALTVHAQPEPNSIKQAAAPAPGRSRQPGKPATAAQNAAQRNPAASERTTRQAPVTKEAKATPGDVSQDVSPADEAHVQPPTAANTATSGVASLHSEPAAHDPGRDPAQKRGRVPSRRIAALQGSPGPDEPPARHKRPAVDAPDGGVSAVVDGAPALPRAGGGGRTRAKRSKRQQLDDEVVKAKYLADLGQYVEERGDALTSDAGLLLVYPEVRVLLCMRLCLSCLPAGT